MHTALELSKSLLASSSTSALPSFGVWPKIYLPSTIKVSLCIQNEFSCADWPIFCQRTAKSAQNQKGTRLECLWYLEYITFGMAFAYSPTTSSRIYFAFILSYPSQNDNFANLLHIMTHIFFRE